MLSFAMNSLTSFKSLWVGAILLICCLFAVGEVFAFEVKSPDGRVVASVEVQDFAGAKGCLVYSVRYRGKVIVAPSRMSLEVEGKPFGENLGVARTHESRQDTVWVPVYGERARIVDNSRSLEVYLREKAVPGRELKVTFRVYNEGAAFCYTIPEQAAMKTVTLRERTEFRLPDDSPVWATYTAQGLYEKVPVSGVKPGCERPLVIEAARDRYVALGEARLVDYARMKFSPLAGVPHSLVTESPGKLLENNDLILNLNDRAALTDVSWIKPGKAIREVTLSTKGAKALIDYCAKHHIQYIEFDAGWYGKENDLASDPRVVKVPAGRSQGGLDITEVLRYSKGKGVGVLLYVNHIHLERDLDEILPLYEKWGVKGLKYGFVNVGSQEWTTWLHTAVRKAAAHKLMVDVHDEYRPTGYSATYPNLMTQEGIRGDETSPVNTQTLTILFTRMLAGAADNTICYYAPRVDANGTHAYQLAKAVCFYSPWQFLYWYDRPVWEGEQAKGGLIGDEPETAFFDAVPTVWDETKVLQGVIGEYAVLGRRSGAEWFVGFMNAKMPRAFAVPLSFLEQGKRYVAYVYSDDAAVGTRTKVRVEKFLVESGTVLRMSASAQGGQAVRLVPAAAADSTIPRYK